MTYSVDGLDFLEQHNTGFIATLGQSGQPWGAVVYYIADQYGNVLFYTKNKTRKLTHIRRDPRVAFVVFDAQKQCILQLTGEATEVEDQKYINHVYQRLTQNVQDSPHTLPIEKLADAGEYVVVKIKVTSAHYVDYIRPASSTSENSQAN